MFTLDSPYTQYHLCQDRITVILLHGLVADFSGLFLELDCFGIF